MLKARLAGKLDISELERSVDKLISDVAKKTITTAKANTPIRSGRARNSWTTKQGPGMFEVQNSVPYIEQLEKGRSRQAPRGIVKPTVRTITGQIKNRRLGR